ncbi:DUF4902 domain-containing protein [Noviherbaspirillum saxi]|uniref:DUF4902 domain-containing protein n=1 Tax=Noviherbaspirillum saxi TaxID=2320863 RepID=UPI001314D0F3|nr:DUF4902 domain-containing protein [Noviherbaspirillum saxi]
MQFQSSRNQAPAKSPDGYIRLRLASLNALSFVHLFSECDTGFLRELQAQTIPAIAAGFSEWKTMTDPVISIGWGWFIHGDSECMLLAPDGVRSNVMLIDAHGYDLGSQRTSTLFGTWLSSFEWQSVVTVALNEVITPC